MCSIHAIDIMVMTRIDEIIQLLAVMDAVLDENEAVLPHHHGVGGAVDHQELALEFVGLVLKADQIVAFGILLGRVHVTLTIHDFVVLPIQHGTASHANLKHLGVVDLQRCRHESAIAPAVASDAVGIDVR